MMDELAVIGTGMGTGTGGITLTPGTWWGVIKEAREAVTMMT